MYGKIARLAFKNGYCWASNKFLDGTETGRSASRQIQELINTGFVTSRLNNQKQRLLYICRINSKLEEGTLAKNGDPPSLEAADPSPKMATPLARNGDPPSPKMATEHSNQTNLLNTATTAPQLPEPNTDPPSAEIPAAAAPITPEGLKTALQAIDKALILSKPFYPKAAAFMALYGLPEGYLKWMHIQCGLKNPGSFNGLYFTLFFEESMAEQYKTVHQNAAAPPPPDINCPVCGTPHAPLDGKCPSCGLPKDSPAFRIELFQKLDLFNNHLNKAVIIY
jgi:hypothetical protein